MGYSTISYTVRNIHLVTDSECGSKMGHPHDLPSSGRASSQQEVPPVSVGRGLEVT